MVTWTPLLTAFWVARGALVAALFALVSGRFGGREGLKPGTNGPRLRVCCATEYHSAASLIAMTYLCCGGVTVTLPTEGEETYTCS
jgi:hypothetical protein